MTTVYREFNNTAYVTETRTETIELFNEILAEYGQPAWSEKDLQDWSCLTANMTTAEIDEIAHDLVSEMDTEKCVNNAYQYEN